MKLRDDPDYITTGDVLFSEMLGVHGPEAREAWLCKLTPYELDALLAATEDIMRPRPDRASSRLSGQRLVDWNVLVEFSRPGDSAAETHH